MTDSRYSLAEIIVRRADSVLSAFKRFHASALPLKMCVLLILALSFNSAFAQSKPYPATSSRPFYRVDRFALGVKVGRSASIQGLAEIIASAYRGEADRVRAAYTWILANVEYDTSNAAAFTSEAAEMAMTARKAVCSGYASLLVSLCYYMNIDAYYVAGVGRYNGAVMDVGHAWAVVRFGSGQWRCFDPT